MPTSTVGADAQHSGPPDLVTRCVAGERGAWEELILRYQRLIYSVALVHVRDSALADDIFQEVCIELYRRLAELRDPQALPAWLITVTRRKACKLRGGQSDWVELDSGGLPGVERAEAGVEGRFWIERALERLCPRCRAIVEGLYLDPDQPSYAELAGRLGMPVTSLGPTRARCLEKLRQELGRDR